MNRIAQILNGQIHWVFETEESLKQVRERFSSEIIFEDITQTEYQEGWAWDPEKGQAIAPPILIQSPQTIAFDDDTQELEPENLPTLAENRQSCRITGYNKGERIVAVVEGDPLPEVLEQLKEATDVDELVKMSFNQQFRGEEGPESCRIDRLKINIATVSDDQYMVPTTVTLLSILEYTKNPIDFYVIELGVTDEKKEMLRNALAKRNDCTVTFISIPDELFAKVVDPKVNNKSHIHKMAHSKLLLQYLLADLSKVLYIDSDILVMEDINVLYNVDISNDYAAAVRDFGADSNDSVKGRSELSKANTYFNTGLMLINLDKWKENDIFHEFREWYDQNNQVMLLHDQAVFNAVLADKVLLIDDYWNIQQSNRMGFFMENSNAVLLKKGIYHFNGPYKPWREVFNKVVSPTERQIFGGIYCYYLSQLETP